MFYKITNIFSAIFLLLAGFGSVSIAQTCTPAPVGLVSWWAGDGSALDSRSRNNGTLQNGATFTAGQSGQAFSFDGVDDHIVVPHNANQNTGDKITIEGWVNPTSLGSTENGRPFLQKRSTSNVLGYTFETAALPSNAPQSLNFVISIGSVFRTLVTGTVLTDGVWQHIAATYDGQTMLIYHNGVVVGVRAQTGAIDAVTDPIIIGRNAVDTSLAWQGGIDELSLYNRALSASEIAAIHAAGTAGKCKPTATTSPSGLVGWYPGDGNANDISGNNNNGTLQPNAGFAVGRVGQAFSLLVPDTLNHVDLGPGFNLDNLTLETWVFVDSSNSFGNRRVISKDNFTLGGTRKLFNLLSGCASAGANGRPCFSVVIGGGVDTAVAPSALTSGWHHLAAVRDTGANRFELYVDGILAASKIPTVLGAIDSNVNTVIGRVSPTINTETFEGLVDEAAIYSRALTQDEITSIFNAGIAGKLKTATTPTGFALSEPGAVATGFERDAFDASKMLALQSPEVVNTTVGDATIIFPTVTTAGTTQQIPLLAAGLPLLPLGTHTGLLYDLATTAIFTGSPTVCFNLPPFSAAQFTNLRVMHLVSGNWVNVTAAANMFPVLCTFRFPRFRRSRLPLAVRPQRGYRSAAEFSAQKRRPCTEPFCHLRTLKEI